MCVVFWLHFQKWMLAKRKEKKNIEMKNLVQIAFEKTRNPPGFTESEFVESLIVMMDVTEVR